MRTIKYKDGLDDGAYGNGKNRKYTLANKKEKWIIPRSMNYDPWPKMAVAYSTNHVTGAIVINGTRTDPTAARTKGTVVNWAYDGDAWTTPANSYLRGAMVGQPMNWPYVLITQTNAATGTSADLMPDGTATNRPDFLHNMIFSLPYLKQYNQGAGVTSGAYDLVHTCASDIGFDAPRENVAGGAQHIANNRFQRGLGLQMGASGHGTAVQPYYNKMWCSSVKFKITYTITTKGYTQYKEGTAGNWDGAVAHPPNNVVRIGFTPFRAIPKSGNTALELNSYTRHKYTSYDGLNFRMDKTKEHDESSSAYASELNSPFPSSYGEFFGGQTNIETMTTRQESMGTHGPMYKKDYAFKGNTSITDSITGTIVPHKFLGLIPEDGPTLSYEDLAYATCSDLTAMSLDNTTGTAGTLLRSHYLLTALEILAGSKDTAGANTRPTKTQLWLDVKEKMGFLIGCMLQAGTRYEMLTGTTLQVDYNVEFERTIHYYHDGESPQIYAPAAQSYTGEAEAAYNANIWAAGFAAADETDALGPPASDVRTRRLWPNNLDIMSNGF
jgi:hypothetical protein